ncbi:MAG: hypothetical protein JST23_12725 [Bacteroidetes bacterium]|nr:hypothetical protein [Bacteroidota bacterium]
MEKLFTFIVVYSYLLLPISAIIYFALKGTNKSLGVLLSLYGLSVFILLNLFSYIRGFIITKPIYAQLYQSLFTFIEFLVFGVLLYKLIVKPVFKKIIAVSIILFFIFQVFYIFTEQPQRLDSVPIGIETILMFIFVLFFFYERFQDVTGEPIYFHHGFWLSFGMLIYLGASFFFYLLISHLDEKQQGTYGLITYVADITKNLLFVLALFVALSNERAKKAREPKATGAIPFLDMI